ncbi:MAG: tetratricopeptide repeat protein [Nitratireductor sp.]
MPISSVMRNGFKIAFLTLALSAGVGGAMHKPAHAFDAKKVFKEDKPSVKKVLRHYFNKKKRGQNKEAHEALKYAAERGNSAAQWKLGRMYQHGEGVPKSPLEAFNFYKMIADRYGEAQPGRPEWRITGKAMVALGHYYMDGIPEANIAPNKEEALVMYTTSAMYFSDPDAQFELGRIMLNSAVEPEQSRQGVRLLNLSRKKGHAGAQALLGHALVEGDYVLQNVVRGLTMISKAQRNASAEMQGWIQELHQQAFAQATEEQRREAISRLQN